MVPVSVSAMAFLSVAAAHAGQSRLPWLSVSQERRSGKEYAEGFAMLDLDGGAPWDLLCCLMQAAPRKRLSAAAAAAHPALGGGLTGALNSALWRLGAAADQVWGFP